MYCNDLDLFYGFNGGIKAMTWKIVLMVNIFCKCFMTMSI